MLKKLYCKFLFLTTVKQRELNWFVQEIFQNTPLKLVKEIKSSKNITTGYYDIVSGGKDFVGLSNGVNHAVINHDDINSNYRNLANSFSKEFKHFASVVHFINCFVFNKNYKFELFYSIFNQMMNDFDNNSSSYNSYLKTDSFRSIYNYQNYIKNPSNISKFKPPIISTVKKHFVKPFKNVFEREFLYFKSPSTLSGHYGNIGNEGTKLSLLMIDGELYCSISKFTTKENLNDIHLTLDENASSWIEFFPNHKKVSDFSDVVKEFSLSVLSHFDMSEDGVIPNMMDKILYDMEDY